jgi:DNA-binding IclR family transcriptional regulator
MQMASKLHAILTRFQEDRPSWRQVELARALDVSPSALSRSLANLVDLGFLRYDDDTAVYRLGPTIVSLAGAAINEYDEFRQAYSELHALMSDTHLGVNLGLRDGWSVMYLMHLDGPKMKRGNTLIGRHIPLHATALGKVVLAGMSDDTIRDAYRDRPLDAYTVSTITDVDTLLAAIDRVRRHGYATEREELALGRGCMAVPILGRGGGVAAAMSLSGPKDAIALDANEGHYAGLLLDAAERISARLGFRRAVAAPRVAS